jgi:hypothetical protein
LEQASGYATIIPINNIGTHMFNINPELKAFVMEHISQAESIYYMDFGVNLKNIEAIF